MAFGNKDRTFDTLMIALNIAHETDAGTECIVLLMGSIDPSIYYRFPLNYHFHPLLTVLDDY